MNRLLLVGLVAIGLVGCSDPVSSNGDDDGIVTCIVEGKYISGDTIGGVKLMRLIDGVYIASSLNNNNNKDTVDVDPGLRYVIIKGKFVRIYANNYSSSIISRDTTMITKDIVIRY
jgi:hypothetical protein